VTVTAPTDRKAPEASGPVRPAGPARVAGVLGAHLSFYLLIAVGVGAVLLTVNLVANGIWGDVDSSVWDGQASVFQYVILAGGVMVVTGYAPRMVTLGVTRRATADGGLVAVSGLAVAGAAATTLAYGIEHLVFAINDWPHVLDNAEDLHIYDRPDQYGLIFVEILALYLTHVIAGMIIGGGLFRFGWVWGAPFLVGGIALAVAGEYLVRSGFAGVGLTDVLGLDPPPVGVGLAGVIALVAVGALGVRRVIGGMPIEAQDATWWR
jgi:hypothetical protein